MGLRRVEAFKAHKNRLRTRVFQEFHGYQQQDDSVRAGRLPGMMSQGRVHRRLVTVRLQALADQGHEPTTEELASAVSLEHLADMVAACVQAEAAQAEETGGEDGQGRSGPRRKSPS